LKPLQARKRELLLESDLNRQVLRVEVSRLSFRARQFQSGFGWARSVWPWAASLGGLLLARKLKHGTTPLAKGAMWLSTLRTAWKIWTTLREQRPQPGSEN
jgi:hypothetical protein